MYSSTCRIVLPNYKVITTSLVQLEIAFSCSNIMPFGNLVVKSSHPYWFFPFSCSIIQV
jgi:hypothetical protein